MKPVTFGKYFLMVMILALGCCPADAADLKVKALELKINEISVLQTQIIDKIDQAIDMRSRLERQLAEVRGEIRAEQVRADINSPQQAQQNLRIRYNLILIQTLQAYIHLLDERIEYFYSGKERLKFLIDQINDDLAIIDILKDMEIEILIERINLVLDEFIPEVQKQIFNASDIQLLPIEYVWEDICVKPTQTRPF